MDPNDDDFWDKFWSDSVAGPHDVFTLIPGNEIRQLRDESPNNLATLCYKAVEKLVKAVDTSCRTQQDQQTGPCQTEVLMIQQILKFKYLYIFLPIALNCIRLLTHIIPYMFEGLQLQIHIIHAHEIYDTRWLTGLVKNWLGLKLELHRRK